MPQRQERALLDDSPQAGTHYHAALIKWLWPTMAANEYRMDHPG